MCESPAAWRSRELETHSLWVGRTLFLEAFGFFSESLQLIGRAHPHRKGSSASCKLYFTSSGQSAPRTP